METTTTAPAPPLGFPENLMPIGGAWISSSNNANLTVANPATGEPIAEVPSATVHDGLAAVDAAATAKGEVSAYVADKAALAECLSSPLGWLAVDDVQMLGAEGEVMLFSLLNRAAQGDLCLLLSGSNAPAGLEVRADVRTRIGAGLVFHVQPLSDDDKVVALRGRANERGFDLSRDVAEYLLRHGRRDLPSLMVVLDALDRYSLEVKRPVTIPLAREVLQAARGEQ